MVWLFANDVKLKKQKRSEVVGEVEVVYLEEARTRRKKLRIFWIRVAVVAPLVALAAAGEVPLKIMTMLLSQWERVGVWLWTNVVVGVAAALVVVVVVADEKWKRRKGEKR